MQWRNSGLTHPFQSEPPLDAVSACYRVVSSGFRALENEGKGAVRAAKAHVFN